VTKFIGTLGTSGWRERPDRKVELAVTVKSDEKQYVNVSGRGWGVPYSWLHLYQDGHSIGACLPPDNDRAHTMTALGELLPGIETTFTMVLERPRWQLQGVHPSYTPTLTITPHQL
jgi:hypothetical protein